MAFTVCFAVWTIFSIIGIPIRQRLGLSETEFGLLVGLPVLTGSLVRLLLGILSARCGPRLVYVATMLAAAVATLLLALARTYPEMLLAGLGVGLAGGSFAVGVAYVSPMFPPHRQGIALGIFGAGNVGAALTKFLAPVVVVAWGWQAVPEIWSAALVLTAALFWMLTGGDALRGKQASRAVRRSVLEDLAPLQKLQVWRFALYYFFAFGGFVALSLWLPRYLVGVYGFDIGTAGLVAAAYSIPGSIFRVYGGLLSDQIGARKVLYLMFAVSAAATLILCLPGGQPSAALPTISPPVFIGLLLVLGFVMSLGKAAVFKHVTSYYPDDVGAVGGVVGMVGGLGGFVLPIGFGLLKDLTGLWSSCFLLLFLIAAASLAWMHLAVRRIDRNAVPVPLAGAHAAQ
jgi:NNP family nitrate/nitrite transporter-like MFS transporter